MRFSKYIVNDIIERNDIITVYRSANNFIYHSGNVNEYNIFNVNENIIIDKYTHIYNELNKCFKNKFKWDVILKGVKSSRKINEGYNVFVPLGNFNYIWSDKITSIKESISNNFKDVLNEKEQIIFRNMKDDKIDVNILNKIVECYKNININSAIKSGNEIIFECKKYMLINENYMEMIL